MSKTLFWYLLKDLLRIFLMASGTLAGIMSFGALLRPLTQHGLDSSQIGKILTYFQPAMMTYSLPIAALFATTIVYGRVSADNELTACRACGISSWAMTWPAFLLGLVVALISLCFLSFIVPVFTLKVEKVIYSNIAQLIANKITRTHEISYGRTSIFAQAAEVKPSQDGKQVVDLISPMIFTYSRSTCPRTTRPRESPTRTTSPTRCACRPRSGSPSAPAPTSPQKENTVVLEAVMEDGHNFPRDTKGKRRLHRARRSSGPSTWAPPSARTPSSWTSRQLKDLLGNPESSRRLQATVQQFVRDEQREAYFAQVHRLPQGPQRLRSFRISAETETLIISGADLEIRSRAGELVINPASGEGGQFVRVDLESNGDIVSRDKARQVRITLDFPDPPAPTPGQDPQDAAAVPRGLSVTTQEYDSIVQADEDPAAHETYRRTVNIPMPENLQNLEKHDVRHYMSVRNAGKREQEELKVNFQKLISSIRSEMHARASFAVSCFILVMVGLRPGHDLQERQLPLRLRRQRRPRAPLHRPDRHRPARLREHPQVHGHGPLASSGAATSSS